MYNYIVSKLKNVNLQMQSMVNLLDLNKVTSQKHFVSDDLDTDLDPVQAIAPVFGETSKFFTPLQCDLETEINKPTYRKIFVSSNMSPDTSEDLASRKIFVSSNMYPDPSAGFNFKEVTISSQYFLA